MAGVQIKTEIIQCWLYFYTFVCKCDISMGSINLQSESFLRNHCKITSVANRATTIHTVIIVLSKSPKREKKNAVTKLLNAVHHSMSNYVQRHHPMIDLLPSCKDVISFPFQMVCFFINGNLTICSPEINCSEYFTGPWEVC